MVYFYLINPITHLMQHNFLYGEATISYSISIKMLRVAI